MSHVEVITPPLATGERASLAPLARTAEFLEVVAQSVAAAAAPSVVLASVPGDDLPRGRQRHVAIDSGRDRRRDPLGLHDQPAGTAHRILGIARHVHRQRPRLGGRVCGEHKEPGKRPETRQRGDVGDVGDGPVVAGVCLDRVQHRGHVRVDRAPLTRERDELGEANRRAASQSQQIQSI